MMKKGSNHIWHIYLICLIVKYYLQPPFTKYLWKRKMCTDWLRWATGPLLRHEVHNIHSIWMLKLPWKGLSRQLFYYLAFLDDRKGSNKHVLLTAWTFFKIILINYCVGWPGKVTFTITLHGHLMLYSNYWNELQSRYMLGTRPPCHLDNSHFPFFNNMFSASHVLIKKLGH